MGGWLLVGEEGEEGAAEVEEGAGVKAKEEVLEGEEAHISKG